MLKGSLSLKTWLGRRERCTPMAFVGFFPPGIICARFLVCRMGPSQVGQGCGGAAVPRGGDAVCSQI